MVPKHVLFAFLVAMSSTTTMRAQEVERSASPQSPQPPAQPPAAAQAGEKPQEARRPARGELVNILVEVTITDQTGTSPADKKTVSLIVHDGRLGRVRANAETNKPSLGRVGTNLNVDARPTIVDANRVLLELTLEYTPLRDSDTVRPTNLNESVAIVLTSGKPLMVSQAADPIVDRRMTVEAKATILR